MSSGVSRDDLEQAIWMAGVRDRAVVNRLMRVVDAYVYHAARDMAADQMSRAAPEVTTETRKRTYKCIGDCRQFKTLEEFPERKQQNPKLPSACSYCDSRTVRLEDAGHVRNRSLSFRDEKIG